MTKNAVLSKNEHMKGIELRFPNWETFAKNEQEQIIQKMKSFQFRFTKSNNNPRWWVKADSLTESQVKKLKVFIEELNEKKIENAKKTKEKTTKQVKVVNNEIEKTVENVDLTSLLKRVEYLEETIKTLSDIVAKLVNKLTKKQSK